MQQSSRSLFIFGIYSIGLGLILLLVPNFLFGIFGVPPTDEVWIRVSGMLLFCLGIYYVLAGRANLTQFVRWTVYTRASVILFFTAFVLLGLAPPVLISLGVVDLGFATWTWTSLRKEDRSPPKAFRHAAGRE